MKHSFTIVKHVKCSRSNVIANYLDLEHMPAHSGLEGVPGHERGRAGRLLRDHLEGGPFEIPQYPLL